MKTKSKWKYETPEPDQIREAIKRGELRGAYGQRPPNMRMIAFRREYLELCKKHGVIILSDGEAITIDDVAGSEWSKAETLKAIDKAWGLGQDLDWWDDPGAEALAAKQ